MGSYTLYRMNNTAKGPVSETIIFCLVPLVNHQQRYLCSGSSSFQVRIGNPKALTAQYPKLSLFQCHLTFSVKLLISVHSRLLVFLLQFEHAIYLPELQVYRAALFLRGLSPIIIRVFFEYF